MFAIVEACGRQYQIETGRFVDLDLLNANAGDGFNFDKVLAIVDGGNSTLGQPYVQGARATGRVLAHGQTKKVIVYHMRPKKGTRKKQGHRQDYTRVLIDTIELDGKVLCQAAAKPKKESLSKAESTSKSETAGKEKSANRKESTNKPDQISKKRNDKQEKPATEA